MFYSAGLSRKLWGPLSPPVGQRKSEGGGPYLWMALSLILLIRLKQRLC